MWMTASTDELICFLVWLLPETAMAVRGGVGGRATFRSFYFQPSRDTRPSDYTNYLQSSRCIMRYYTLVFAIDTHRNGCAAPTMHLPSPDSSEARTEAPAALV